MRNAVKGRCGRGRVELRVSLEHPTGSVTEASMVERAAQLHASLEAVRAALSLDDPVTLDHLMAAGLGNGSVTERHPPDSLADWVLPLALEAIDGLVAARDAEGESLVTDFTERLRDARGIVASIETMCATLGDQLRERLHTRISEVLAKLESPEPLDDARVLQELAVYLDKGDITEEIVRARSHIETLLSLFESGNPEGSAVGKRVDFFLQELGREANTMGSKSSDPGLTELVVGLKTQIERLREQAQNLE